MQDKICHNSLWFTWLRYPSPPILAKHPPLTPIIVSFILSLVLTLYQVSAGAETIVGVVKNQGIKKSPIVVYIDEIPGMTFTPSGRPEMDQRNKEFVPRVLPVLVGSTVNFLNNDGIKHNVMSPDNERYELGTVGGGEVLSYTFNNSGVYAQLCRVHSEMVGYIVVVKTPYFALTDPKGNFKIGDVPPGRYKLKVWGERLRPAQLKKDFPVTVESGKGCRIEINP